MYPEKPELTRKLLSLPPATMVIDVRGQGRDIIDMVRLEIINLAEGMKEQIVQSSLADFIAFKVFDPDILVGEGSAGQEDPHGLQYCVLPGQDDEAEPVSPHPDFADLPAEINHLHSIRLGVLSNRSTSTDDTIEHYPQPSMVRVIFLTNARNFNSLSCAAGCAKYLKEYYRRLEDSPGSIGGKSPIYITVLCSNHQGNLQTPPELLIEGLSYYGEFEHLDSLILSEEYRQDLAQIGDDMQKNFAELLLYVLLLVSSTFVQTNLTVLKNSASEPGDQNAQEQPQEPQVTLPEYTYLVGLSSVEHSTRWGYRLLNYGLAEKVLEIWLERCQSDEIQAVQQQVASQLDMWQQEVREILVEKLPSAFSDLRVLAPAMKGAVSIQEDFSISHPGWKPGRRGVRKNHIDELEQYLNALTATYSGSPASAGQKPPSTLERAVSSVQEIMRVLEQRGKSEPEMPLEAVQRNIYEVLEHPPFFNGHHGAIPRARLQLEKFADAIEERREMRLQNPIDVHARQAALRKLGEGHIADLRERVRKAPFFGRKTRSVAIFAGLSVLSWYSSISPLLLGLIALLIVALLIILVRIRSALVRQRKLRKNYTSAAQAIREQHLRNKEEATTSIAEALTLELLKSAGLEKDQSGHSPYHTYIRNLSYLLHRTSSHIQFERKQVESILDQKTRKDHLVIREELLNRAGLELGYDDLRRPVNRTRDDNLIRLSMVLLRAMGQQKPDNFKQQTGEQSRRDGSESSHKQKLMEELTAVTLRFSISVSSSDLPTSLVEHYKEERNKTDSKLSAFSLLFEALNNKLSTTTLGKEQESMEAIPIKGLDVSLATQALVLWSQVFWEENDTKLCKTLAPGSVIAKLLQEGNSYKPQAVVNNLSLRASPAGRSLIGEKLPDREFFLVWPSSDSKEYLSAVISMDHFMPFRDPERLLLMRIKPYRAKALPIK